MTLAVPQLEAVRSAEDFIGREHFEAFREQYTPVTVPDVATRAFHSLVDSCSTVEAKTLGAPRPYSGIEIVQRQDLGWPSYRTDRMLSVRSRNLAVFAVQAKGITGLAEELDELQVPRARENLTVSFIRDFGSLLRRQFDS